MIKRMICTCMILVAMVSCMCRVDEVCAAENEPNNGMVEVEDNYKLTDKFDLGNGLTCKAYEEDENIL